METEEVELSEGVQLLLMMGLTFGIRTPEVRTKIVGISELRGHMKELGVP